MTLIVDLNVGSGIGAEDNAIFYRSVPQSDEAQLKLNGQLNRYNCVYWASENPHITIAEQLNVSDMTVWVRIHAGGAVGPYFFDGNDAENYLPLLIDLSGEFANKPQLADIFYFFLRQRSITLQTTNSNQFTSRITRFAIGQEEVGELSGHRCRQT